MGVTSASVVVILDAYSIATPNSPPVLCNGDFRHRPKEAGVRSSALHLGPAVHPTHETNPQDDHKCGTCERSSMIH